jgi:hypothetical protein
MFITFKKSFKQEKILSTRNIKCKIMIRNQRKCKKMFCLNENSHDIKHKLENPLIYLIIALTL